MSCIIETLRCVLCCEEELSSDYYDDYDAFDHESCICIPIATAVAGALSCLFEGISSVVERISYRRVSNIRGSFSSSASSSSSYQPINYSPAQLPQKPQILPPPLPSSSSSSSSLLSVSYSPGKLPQKPLLLPPPPSLARNYSPVKLPEAAPKHILISTTTTISSAGTGVEKKKPDLIKQEPIKQAEVPKSSNSPVVQRSLLDQSPSILVPAKHVTKSENKKSEVPKISTSSVPHANLKDPSPSSFSSRPTPSSLKPSPLTPLGPALSPSPSGPSVSEKKTNYFWVQKDTTPLYVIPDHLRELIGKDIVPAVLKKEVTPSTYKDYFAALLYAEDFYIEKWSDFHLNDVTLELQNAAICMKSRNNKISIENDIQNDKKFVAFKIDSVPERRPFLLSRDFVFLQPSGKTVEPFQGILYRVIESTIVLAEFGDDFHSRHSRNCKYDVRFSFNRVCLKRSHQAIAGSTHLFQNFLFPSKTSRMSFLNPPVVIPQYRNLSMEQCAAINNISRLKDPLPYLIEGPLSVITVRKRSNTQSEVIERKLSSTGLVIKEAVLRIYRTSPGCRILISAPTNSTCDMFMRSLKVEIPESDIFRANAAFRELDGVPYDILPFCPYEGECFTCPSLLELQSFKVVLSTFVSSFRLYDNGLSAGHFSHIFLVDASSVTEPEVMVVLANFADETTVVVVTGATGNQSRWVRSDIARRNGLRVSYFQRLLRSKPYNSYDPMFVTQISKEEP